MLIFLECVKFEHENHAFPANVYGAPEKRYRINDTFQARNAKEIYYETFESWTALEQHAIEMKADIGLQAFGKAFQNLITDKRSASC